MNNPNKVGLVAGAVIAAWYLCLIFNYEETKH